MFDEDTVQAVAATTSSTIAPSSASSDVNYYSSDFNFDDWKDYCHHHLQLPSIINTCGAMLGEEAVQWNHFYSTHQSGRVYKPRNYLAVEFHRFIEAASCLLEVGCGYGCSMFPLLSSFPNIQKYYATEYSIEAIQLLTTHSLFDPIRCVALLWDATATLLPEGIPSFCVTGTVDAAAGIVPGNDAIADTAAFETNYHEYKDTTSAACVTEGDMLTDYDIMNPLPQVILCIFTLSAVHPSKHVQFLSNLKHLLQLNQNHGSNKSTSSHMQQYVICFRDYGEHDMTMYRHHQRFGDNLFQRSDGTIAFYFNLHYLRSLCEEVDLKVLELEYATVINTNRKNGKEMHRVFVHGVFAINDY